MRNTVTNYLAKVSKDQIKNIVDRKKFIVTETLCDTAMQELKKIYLADNIGMSKKAIPIMA